MPGRISSVTDLVVRAGQPGARMVAFGIAGVVGILTVSAVLLFLNLPSADAFNARVERIFMENDALTTADQLKLLEVMAQSGTAFAEVLASYRMIIFILMLFATGLLVTSLVFLVTIVAQNRRMGEMQRQGIRVASLVISRERNAVSINDMEFQLTPAALETLAVLAEARLDEDILTGAQIEGVISGRRSEDCDEAAGATRIKRLRDSLGNQMVSELLVKNIARKGYVLAIDPAVIRML